MTEYNEEMAKAGVLVSGDGLHPSSRGARVEFTDSNPSVTDGPFTETKELIAGFTIIDVDSLADAVAWARRWPAILTEATSSSKSDPEGTQPADG